MNQIREKEELYTFETCYMDSYFAFLSLWFDGDVEMLKSEFPPPPPPLHIILLHAYALPKLKGNTFFSSENKNKL